jgi:hypothetical protein
MTSTGGVGANTIFFQGLLPHGDRLPIGTYTVKATAKTGSTGSLPSTL